MKILIALAVAVRVVLGLSATQPDSFTVQRSIQIKAAPDKIYPLVADFHRWTEWSPWAALPPARARSTPGKATARWVPGA